jgi:hypothetical protein
LALFDAKTIADLTKLSTPTLTRAFDDLGFTTKDRGAVELALSKATSQDGTTALAKSVDAQRMATMFPWVPAEEKAIRQLRRFADDWATNGEAKAMATLKQEYIARAKAGMLTPTEALIGQYTLFCSSDDTKYGSFMLMSLMLRVPVDDRVSIHNWAIAQEMPNATKEAYGAAIAQLSFPLFPVDEQLTATNTKLLTGISPSGGSVNTVFATQPTGAGGLPLLQATDGTYGVDTTPIEQPFGSEIQNLRREVANLRSRLNAANQQANVANQQANTTASFAQNRGGYRGGRSRGNGYSGQRGSHLRGGDTAPDTLDDLFGTPAKQPSTPVQPPAWQPHQAAPPPPPPPPPPQQRGDNTPPTATRRFQ